MSTVMSMSGPLWAVCCTVALGMACRANFEAVPDASPDANTLSLGCELHLAMDEALWQGLAGEVVDKCGGDDAATAIGQLTTGTDPLRGRVGVFPGAGYLVIPDSPRVRGTNGVTLSAWIKPLAPVGTPPAGIIAKRASFGVKSSYTMFLWTNSHLWTDIDQENDRVEVPASILPERWTHVTVVYDGGSPKPKRIRTYQDGFPTGQWAESSSQIPAAFDAALTIGHLPDQEDPNLTFRGSLDDVVIWSRALKDEEVAAWHTATKR